MSSVLHLMAVAGVVYGSSGVAQPLASGRSAGSSAQNNSTKLHSFHLGGKTGFEANLGQAPPGIRFFLRMRHAVLLLTGEGATLALASEGGAGRSAIRMKLAGISPHVRVEGVGELVAKTNYFIGADSAGWVTGAPQYASVRYRSVYPGVDLVFRQSEDGIEYDWVVAPGGDFRRIRMIFKGVDGLDVNSDGALVARCNGMVLRSGRPISFQGADASGAQVGVQYRIDRRRKEARFSVSSYNPAKTLVIDPVLTYSAVFGGSGFESQLNGLELDVGNGIAVDSSGNAYIVGTAYSPDFSAFNSTIAQRHGVDAFVAKLDAGGSLLYVSFLGSAFDDTGSGIAVDAVGNAYVTGATGGSDFPVFNALQPKAGGGGGRFCCEIEPGRLRADLLDLSWW